MEDVFDDDRDMGALLSSGEHRAVSSIDSRRRLLSFTVFEVGRVFAGRGVRSASFIIRGWWRDKARLQLNEDRTRIANVS